MVVLKADKALYRHLGVSKSDSTATIRQAYLEKALSCHPEKYPNDKIKHNEFKQISQAHNILIDQQKRDIYDRLGKNGLKLMDSVGVTQAEIIVNNLNLGGAKDYDDSGCCGSCRQILTSCLWFWLTGCCCLCFCCCFGCCCGCFCGCCSCRECRKGLHNSVKEAKDTDYKSMANEFKEVKDSPEFQTGFKNELVARQILHPTINPPESTEKPGLHGMASSTFDVAPALPDGDVVVHQPRGLPGL